MKSVEHKFKVIKIKAVVKLDMNPDPMMRSVRVFEERAAERGFASLVKYAHRYVEELGTTKFPLFRSFQDVNMPL